MNGYSGLGYDDEPDIFGLTADILAPQASQYETKPVSWVRDRLSEWLTVDQAKILKSVRDNRYTAVKSCHDTGKSHTASRAAGWWLDSFPPGEAFVVTTAPTRAQVANILWRYMGQMHRKGGLLGRITGDLVWKYGWGAADSPDEPIAYGRKPADYDQAAFQGIHARYVLVIIDEACGVGKSMFDAVDTLVTNKFSRVLAIGNPDDPSSHFATVCKEDSGWNVIRINGLESPNFTEEEISGFPAVRELMASMGIGPSIEYVPEDLRSLLIDVGWVDERIKRWGVTSPLFTSKVLGDFPKVSHDSLIEPGWVIQAQYRDMTPVPTDASFGVDVARYGSDKTVIYKREGPVCRRVFEAGKTSVTETAGEVENLVKFHPHQPIAQVDDTGVGGGVTDILASKNVDVRALISSGAPTEFWANGRPKFADLRSQWYWGLREAFQYEKIDIALEDDELAAQLGNIKYTVLPSGKIKVESKEDMKKRGVDSPDRADALCYSWIQGQYGAKALEAIEHHVGRSMTGDLLTMEL